MSGRIWLVDFPPGEEADLRIQLGRVLPETVVEAMPSAMLDGQMDAESLIFIRDSVTAEATVMRLFEQAPETNIVVLADAGHQERATELMRLGAMDYRILPCPDEAFEIYARKAGHQAALARQARRQKEQADAFVTRDLETRRLLNQVALIAPSQASVLVVGESGTGKERLSRFIHQCSNRKDGPFIAVNCAAIPEGMLESELFGHEKGAFTGADRARPGKFELAHQGTLLLDEITEMPLHLQAKLLRVLQEGEVDRLGGRAPVKVDVRIIATSNRDIEKTVAEGKFRQDLYYRLNVVTVRLPALRDRPGDIEPLARHFLDRFAAMYGKPAPELGAEALGALTAHDWPGNARELENCMHRALLMAVDGCIRREHLGLPEAMGAAPAAGRQEENASAAIAAGMSIRDMERALIRETLKHVRGNRTEAARLLGISIRTLRNKLNDMKTATGTPLARSSMPGKSDADNASGGATVMPGAS